ncbi:MAG TPA: sugar-binding protein, partial [Candidatus Methylacidiphilales bacterium]
GFYRVYAKLSGGTKLRALGSRAEGFLTYAVVPEAAKRKLYPEDETLFGMQGGFGPWANEVLAYLGARWVLDGSLEWKKNEPTGPGQFTAAAAANAKKEERKPSPDDAVDWKTYTLPTLYAAPAWAVVPETFAYMTGALTPDGEKAWADYCRQAALAYAAKNPDRASHLYQITWEPIAPWGFKGTKAQLARIYEIAHRALHEADPKAVVGGFTMGIVPEDVEQTSGVLKAGAGPNLDLVTTHPYFSIEAERDGMIPAVRSLKEAVRRLAGREIPLVGTEQGYSTQEDPAKDIVHARGLLRQNLIVLGEGFKFNFAYYVVDYRLGEQRGYGYYYNLVDGVPWAPAKAGPRPAAPALAAQSFLLDGHRAAGAIEWLGNDSWGYAFERPGDVVLALWNYGAQPRSVTIPVGAKQVRVYDWMGNERSEAAEKGNLTLQLGPEPLYVRDVAPTLWGSAAGKVLSLASKTLVSYPGEKVTVTGAVANDQDAALAGKLSLEADPRLAANVAPRDVKVAKGTSAPFAFDFTVPPTLAPGSYPVKVSVSNDLGAYAVNGASLRVEPPVALARVQQAEERAGAKGVSLLLRDMQGKGAEGTVEVELAGVEGSKVSKEFTIPPQGEAPVEFRYPALPLDNAKTYRAAVRVALKSGYAFGQENPVNFVTARRFPAPPALDGNAAAWQSAPVVALGKQQLIRSPQYYSGEADESAVLRFKWDAEALYLEAEVTDDVFLQDFTGADTWKGDSIQLSVNLDPRKDESATGNLLADVANKQRWSELAFAQTRNGPEAFRHISFDPEQFPLGPVAAKDFRMNVRRDEAKKLTLYEIAVPWKTLGGTAAPQPGSVVGIALCLNDRDEPDQKDPSALGLFGGIYPSKNVKKLGLLLLGQEP